MTKNETGHVKDLATLEQLIAYCRAYGEKYNPAKLELQLKNLDDLFANAHAAVDGVNKASSEYSNAINARAILFEPLPKLSTRILSALKASGTTFEQLSDAHGVVRKLRGERAKTVQAKTDQPLNPDSSEIQDQENTAPSIKRISTAQTGYENRTGNMVRLLALLQSAPNYVPNEKELSVEGLTMLIESLNAANTNVINAVAALSNARIARDKFINVGSTSIAAIATEVKNYLRSVFGTTTPEYKQVSGLRFSTRK